MEAEAPSAAKGCAQMRCTYAGVGTQAGSASTRLGPNNIDYISPGCWLPPRPVSRSASLRTAGVTGRCAAGCASPANGSGRAYVSVCVPQPSPRMPATCGWPSHSTPATPVTPSPLVWPPRSPPSSCRERHGRGRGALGPGCHELGGNMGPNTPTQRPGSGLVCCAPPAEKSGGVWREQKRTKGWVGNAVDQFTRASRSVISDSDVVRKARAGSAALGVPEAPPPPSSEPWPQPATVSKLNYPLSASTPTVGRAYEACT